MKVRDQKSTSRPSFPLFSSLSRGQGFDLRAFLVEALADELGRRFGGNRVLNTIEADRFIDCFSRGEPPLAAAASHDAEGTNASPPRGGIADAPMAFTETNPDAAQPALDRCGRLESPCLVPAVEESDGFASS
ncbi:MAG: hypothetical protein LW636_05765 [Planctomycetaceae bacterium]|jgi:hypothetical protein|nr:hypothetical protein [Planctomycetaceae bacterium]